MAKIGKTVTKQTKHTAEDKLVFYYYKAVEYFQQNKNRVYTVIGILVAIIAVIFIYFRSQSQKSETAALELSKVKQYYTMDMFQTAISGDSLGISKGLQYIVDNYGSTESGESAKIMLANSFYSLRDFDKADKYYREYSGKNDMLKAASLSGIASVEELKGDFSSAAKNYEKASKVSKNLTNSDEYLFYAIRCYFNAKDYDNLKKLVKELKNDYPKSKYLGMIAKYDYVIES
jgi:tetratricopeptide (TPR) repeat protein